ncbi:high-affinity branched-chain amino acid ABC transporter permease LivM [Lacibacterium aquatile]|uniref:High-affinity branched-chain amino acid ABC transporter permease LivM n=1 Tax=Lacibacterium aquatile TaxID=1168082 RepID=A0ABW5DQY8_9PROT
MTDTTAPELRKTLDLGAILKDAALAAFVSLFLAIPLLGMETYDAGGRLGVRERWWWVGIAVVAVFFGKALVNVWMALRPQNKKPKTVSEASIRRGQIIVKALSFAMLLFALTLPALPFSDRWWLDNGITVLIYVMLGWGLNIVVGLAGLLDLGYVAFYAVGAYSYALLSTAYDISFWLVLPTAGIFAAIFGILLGFPTLRLRGDYLAIVTLGFGEIIRIVLLNWGSFTGGPNGIASIPRPTFFGFPFARTAPEGQTAFHEVFGLEYSSEHRVVFLYFLILALALMTNWLVLRLRKLPIGRAWEALREDEIACKSLGINPTNTKLTAFAIGAMLGGFAGAFFSAKQGFVSPESFTFIESATILAIVVLGGMGSQFGVVIAATVLVLFPELARGLELYRMLIFGLAMILIMIWRPQGFMSHREPTLRLNSGKGA